MKNIFIFIISLFSITQIYAQVPAPIDEVDNVLIIDATIHIGNGEKLDKGSILIKNGKIEAISSEGIPVDKTVKVINAKGKHIYPGFINVNNTLGITEIDAVRASRDFRESGTINPNVRSQIAFNTESRVVSTVRSNGVLLSQVTPRGGMISGQSSVMFLGGWNWEDATVRKDDGIHMNWPNHKYKEWWNHGEIKDNKNKEKQIQEMNTLFEDALAYSKTTSTEPNLKLEALKGLFDGSKNLYIHVREEIQVMEAVEFAKKHQVKNITLVGIQKVHHLVDYIKENNLSVMLNRVHSLPQGQDAHVLEAYMAAKQLEKAGILYCLSWSGDMEAMNSRNLPFGAGTTVSYGVPYEKAVESITLSPAKILGIQEQYGSLEKGKSATLIISEGDALDMRSNKIIHAWFDGKPINLNNPQKELSKKYSSKYKIEITE